MADPRYAHMGTPIIKLAEECAEVIQSCMKIERFGIDNYHPVTKETNTDALKRELADLKSRIAEVEMIFEAKKNVERWPNGGGLGTMV